MNKKTFWLLVIVICLGFGVLMFGFIYGCGQQQGGGGGTGIIGFYYGKPAAGVSSSARAMALLPYPWLKEARIYVERIDISQTGATWETVLSGTREVTITSSDAPLFIGNSASVPAGQYEGVRIKIQPKITWVTTTDTLVTCESVPNFLIANQMGFFPSSGMLGQTTQATFSTLNGYLTAFQVEASTMESVPSTYVIFEMRPDLERSGSYDPNAGPPPTSEGWEIAMVCRATRFIY